MQVFFAKQRSKATMKRTQQLYNERTLLANEKLAGYQYRRRPI